MNIRVWAGVVLMIALPAIAWAQRPLVYPLRSQSPGAQSIDSAYCYWQAKKQTGVDIVRQPQRPLRTNPINFASDAGRGTSEPPLPASADHAGAASAGAGASASTGASQTTASAASGTSAASGPSVTAGGASEAKLPPLPPPEPPMTTYWRAYGDCMQSRGYGVR